MKSKSLLSFTHQFLSSWVLYMLEIPAMHFHSCSCLPGIFCSICLMSQDGKGICLQKLCEAQEHMLRNYVFLGHGSATCEPAESC